jgi:hypothetical protein
VENESRKENDREADKGQIRGLGDREIRSGL